MRQQRQVQLLWLVQQERQQQMRQQRKDQQPKRREVCSFFNFLEIKRCSKISPSKLWKAHL